VNRRKLEKHMRGHGCSLRREGGSHSIWENPEKGTTAAVPRHGEVNDHTARGICKDLGIPLP
jgi:mRNA interferase HicA